MSTAGPLLELDAVVKQYVDKRAVDGLSFAVPQGSLFGLLGPNGAGKTSTIRMITRITRPDGGHIRFNGQPLADRHQGEIGYMPEERGLYRKMKVREQLVYLLRLKGLSKSDATTRTNAWLERFGLADRADAKTGDFSKGMQQKVQFIATVAHQPPLLILDEPFSGLDPLNAQLLEDILFELRAQGTTIIFSTHRMEQVEELCERIVLVNNGQNVLEGELASIRKRYRKPRFLLEADGGLDAVSLPDGAVVRKRTDQRLELELPDGTDPTAFLADINQQVRLTGFEHVAPSLREIFIQTVQGTSEDSAVPATA